MLGFPNEYNETSDETRVDLFQYFEFWYIISHAAF